MNKQQSDNIMGTMPIPKLVITMGVPLMLSMLSQALYNIVDSMFVSYIGENALTAVSLAYPIQNLMTAFATGTGVGVNALLSMRLGQKNTEEANKVAKHAFFLAACTYIVFCIFGLFFIESYYKTQTSDPEILAQSILYTEISVYVSFGVFGVIACNRLLQSTGKTFLGMIVQMSGVVINIALDPLLIFGLAGFPKLGIAGAAWATVIAQISSFALGIFFNLKYNTELNLSLKKFKPHKEIILRIYKVGIPSIAMTSIGSIMVSCINIILAPFSSTAIAVFGVFFKLNSFAVMPVLGLNNGIVPIVAYNYGAKNKKRLNHTIYFSAILGFSLTLIMAIIFQIFPLQLIKLFNPSPEMIEMGIPALRIMSLTFVIAGIGITFSGIFQAFGRAGFSLIMSLARQLVVIVPLGYVLSLTGVLEAIWWAFPISEVVSVILGIVFMIKVKKTILLKIGNL